MRARARRKAGRRVIRPLKGMQTSLLSCNADLILAGGRTGPGKTYALLMRTLYYLRDRMPASCLSLRRRKKDIHSPAGLKRKAREIFISAGAGFRASPTMDFTWNLTGGDQLIHTLDALPEAGSEEELQGTDYDLIGFDELTHFLLQHFTYAFTRIFRDASMPSTLIGTLNPTKLPWVRSMLEWWIGEDGWIIPEREGVIRYITGAPDDWAEAFVTGDTVDDVLRLAPHKKSHEVRTFTFFEGKREHQTYVDWEQYEGSMSMLPDWQREQLGGNWNAGPKDETKIFDPPRSLLFEVDDEDFQAFMRSGVEATQYAAWDYGRSEHGLCRGWGVVQPGAPPILWILEAKVWTDRPGYKKAAADAKLCRQRVPIDLNYGWLYEAGDPSGFARDSGLGWVAGLRSEGIQIQDLRHSTTKERGEIYWNSAEGFQHTIQLAQAWMDQGRVRILNGPSCRHLITALHEWSFAVPDGMRPIEVSRDRLGPDKGLHSHPGDMFRYLVAFVQASLAAQANPINDLSARKNPRRTLAGANAARNIRL